MRRPGFLGETHYWFGNAAGPNYRFFGNNPCVVCKDNRCTNICTKAEQKQAVKKRHAGIRAAAKGVAKMNIAKGAAISPEFAMRPGESRNQRLARLQRAKLYTPGAKMTHDYSNLVNWGTTDRSKIAQMKRSRKQRVEKQNIKRYKTTDIKQIVEIEKQRQKEKEAMWRRVYGTANTDKIYAIPAQTRRALCDADKECVRIRNRADNT